MGKSECSKFFQDGLASNPGCTPSVAPSVPVTVIKLLPGCCLCKSSELSTEEFMRLIRYIPATSH